MIEFSRSYWLESYVKTIKLTMIIYANISLLSAIDYDTNCTLKRKMYWCYVRCFVGADTNDEP